MDLFLGIDTGGTSTRAAVADKRGALVGRGLAAGGNPTTRGMAAAVQRMSEAVQQAMSGLQPRDVRAAVVGMAGLGENRDAFRVLWPALGLTVAPVLVGDVDVAFAAGTSAPDGTVLIAGTGAIAATVVDHASVEYSDGLGWLVGDEGSAFWIGKEGLKAVLEELRCPGEEISPLASAVTSETLGVDTATPRLFEPLLAAAYDANPLSLAGLAPLVTSAAADDPAAAAIVDRAAEALTATVVRIREPGDPTPIVLAGSVLNPDSPVRAAVRERLQERWDVELADAGDTAAAAAWLAAREWSPYPAGLHRRLVRAA